MRIVRRLMKPAVVMGAGAAAAYFFDPENGRRRRAVARDKVDSTQRRMSERAETKARYAEGVVAGMEAKAEGKGQFHPDGDRSIADHLHQVLKGLPFDTSTVELDVVEGVVGLRGQLATPHQIRKTKDAVARVPGVVSIKSWLHLPGTMAPNKAEALLASHSLSR